MKKITFLGLGVMGFHMAGHLATAGHQVTVMNRSKEKVTQWLKKFHGASADTPEHAVKEADLIISCLGDDQSLIDTYLGDNGVLACAKAGTVIIDHTTASAEIAETLYATAQKHSVGFLDAPISGGEQGAIKGVLTIMCGGDEESFTKSAPIMNHYGRAVTLMGPSGSGQRTKMVNQIAIAGLIQGLAESLHFATNAGLDAHKVIEVISQGAAQSWQMDNRHKTMLAGEYEHGFAVDLMRKDLEICLKEANRNGSTLPVAALVDQFYAEVQQMGGNRWDTSSLLARLNRNTAK